jgi:hypothetical protein
MQTRQDQWGTLYRRNSMWISSVVQELIGALVRLGRRVREKYVAKSKKGTGAAGMPGADAPW